MENKRESILKQKEEAELKVQQYQHRIQLLENRKKNLEKKADKQRTHHLCNMGGAIQSISKEADSLTRVEFYSLMEQVFALPAVQELVSQAMQGHEAGGEDHPDGVVDRQEGHGDAVEARGGQGLVGGPVELRVPRQVIQGSARARQGASDGHGQHDVALVLDARIPGGMAVGAAGLELIAQGGLAHDNVHEDGNENGDEDAHVHLGVGEDVVQPHLGGGYTVVGGLVDVAGLGILHHVFEVAHVKHPGDQVGRQPVGHDAGQDLVDVQEGLEQAGDGPPHGAGQAAAQEGDDPHQGRRDRLSGDTQGQHEGDHGAHEVLARRTDVEQAGLEGHSHRQTGEDQGGGPEEHVAQVGGVKAKGQLPRRVPPGAKDATHNQADAIPSAGQGEVVAGSRHDEHDDAAHYQADEDGEDGGQDGAGRLLLHPGGKTLFHALSPPFSVLFAPAIYRPSSCTSVFFGSSSPTIWPS